MIVLNKRYRVCADCRSVLPAQRFYKRKQRRRTQRKNAAVRYLTDSYCRPCRQERTREQYQARRADPRRRKAENARLAASARERRRTDPEFAERERQRHKAWLESRSPAELERLAQDARIRAALWRESRGAPLPSRRAPDALGAYVEVSRATMLSPGPLLEALPRDWYGDTDAQARALYRLRSGEAQSVGLGVADELLCALGRPWLLPALYG